MADARLRHAISRIDAAVARIEAVGIAPIGADSELAALRASHARLCARTADALAQLDAVIASQTAGPG